MDLENPEIEFNKETGEILVKAKSIPGPYEYWFDDKCTSNRTMRKFGKEERSTWKYFWAHWCAFQMVALNLGIWKFKYLFHDWYKPWLKMFGMKYKDIQRFHRYHSSHHIEWWEDYDTTNKYWFDFDWDALIIDWECSQYTKEACPRNAREEMEYVLQHSDDDNMKHHMNLEMRDRLEELGL